ncbi:MAG: hypothetical protein LBQ09_00805 [Acidobacteriaceae bacterium]|jgi:hypothetical protein|nr:hypothetical protein [Acidobacteriaceae bacterium]
MSIDEIKPYQFVDISHLPLAKMRTSHEFLPGNNQTTIRFTVEVWGLLGFFWRRVVAQNQLKGAATQTASFISYARASA